LGSRPHPVKMLTKQQPITVAIVRLQLALLLYSG
jgi:hypothetical protein